jgi:outer membrane biosynthesis protein TonB
MLLRYTKELNAKVEDLAAAKKTLERLRLIRDVNRLLELLTGDESNAPAQTPEPEPTPTPAPEPTPAPAPEPTPEPAQAPAEPVPETDPKWEEDKAILQAVIAGKHPSLNKPELANDLKKIFERVKGNEDRTALFDQAVNAWANIVIERGMDYLKEQMA